MFECADKFSSLFVGAKMLVFASSYVRFVMYHCITSRRRRAYVCRSALELMHAVHVWLENILTVQQSTQHLKDLINGCCSYKQVLVIGRKLNIDPPICPWYPDAIRSRSDIISQIYVRPINPAACRANKWRPRLVSVYTMYFIPCISVGILGNVVMIQGFPVGILGKVVTLGIRLWYESFKRKF